MWREPAGVSIFGGRVYETDAIAAQSIMPREIPGVVTNMPAPVGPPPPVPGMMPASPAAAAAMAVRRGPPAWHEHAWRSVFGNRIDNQHVPRQPCPPGGMSGWHGHYYTSPFRGFGGLIGFGG